jgi:bifunctional enzyme CysN/CysC
MTKELNAKDISSFLQEQSDKEILRFITCGSVDDGKSTLIGRLLYESKGIFDDQLQAIESDSKQYGTVGEKVDLALLVDGLQAEREQGITIDVAYRYFATDKRRFIVADTPGHEQYTRNTATGASTADLAIILIDARKGVLTQTRRHTRIVEMMGIKQVVLAINKMDLVDYSEEIYKKILADYDSFVAGLDSPLVTQSIPLSGLEGDNVLELSSKTAWYDGPSLMDFLNVVTPVRDKSEDRFILPVQWVNRPNLDFRGFSGRIASGEVKEGDAVRVMPSGVKTKVKSILAGFEGESQAEEGDSITLTLNDEVDASRGDVIVGSDTELQVADQFQAKILWMSENTLSSGRHYLMKMATKEVTATVTRIKYREDINSGEHLAALSIGLNDIAMVNLSISAPVTFSPYKSNRTMGGFILIDKLTFETVGAGMLNFALRRSSNIHWQSLEMDKRTRSEMKHQSPKCIWLTGLSGSGKSTIADILERRLAASGKHTYLLDGDNIRHGLNRDLGFTEEDRIENIRRIAEVAKLMVDSGLIVLVSFISPFSREREMARELFESGEFLEVFVDTPLEECERRDVKGLYKKARSGELKNFTGIDSPYESPKFPELRLKTEQFSAEECATKIEELLSRELNSSRS